MELSTSSSSSWWKKDEAIEKFKSHYQRNNQPVQLSLQISKPCSLIVCSKQSQENFYPSYHLGTWAKAESSTVYALDFGEMVKVFGAQEWGRSKGTEFGQSDQMNSNLNLMLCQHCGSQLSPASGHCWIGETSSWESASIDKSNCLEKGVLNYLMQTFRVSSSDFDMPLIMNHWTPMVLHPWSSNTDVLTSVEAHRLESTRNMPVKMSLLLAQLPATHCGESWILKKRKWGGAY